MTTSEQPPGPATDALGELTDALTRSAGARRHLAHAQQECAEAEERLVHAVTQLHHTLPTVGQHLAASTTHTPPTEIPQQATPTGSARPAPDSAPLWLISLDRVADLRPPTPTSELEYSASAPSPSQWVAPSREDPQPQRDSAGPHHPAATSETTGPAPHTLNLDSSTLTPEPDTTLDSGQADPATATTSPSTGSPGTGSGVFAGDLLAEADLPEHTPTSQQPPARMLVVPLPLFPPTSGGHDSTQAPAATSGPDLPLYDPEITIHGMPDIDTTGHLPPLIPASTTP